eukprot:Nitzschia sp. Nitz4//scaffold82_size85912//28917//29975//NITZ4_005136-RA/size85912-processed-gene-0.113-mRNA-1//-1//CDS//3329558820//8724//frame0
MPSNQLLLALPRSTTSALVGRDSVDDDKKGHGLAATELSSMDLTSPILSAMQPVWKSIDSSTTVSTPPTPPPLALEEETTVQTQHPSQQQILPQIQGIQIPLLGNTHSFLAQSAALSLLLLGFPNVRWFLSALLLSARSMMGRGSAWYMMRLAQFPVVTKATTSAFLGCMGDAAAQVFSFRIKRRRRQRETEDNRDVVFCYDRRRGLANLMDGIFVTGPLMHFAYACLERILPVTSGMAGTAAALTQVFLDDFFLDAIFVGIMFFTTGLGEGYRLGQIWKQLRKDYAGAVRTSWATSLIVMPLEFCLFRFFPLSLRVLGMDIIDMIWEGMVSYMVHKRRKGRSKNSSSVDDV